MIDITLGRNQEMYADYRVALEYLRELDTESWPRLSTTVPFHVYTEVNGDKQLMVIKSFLATQDLDHARMIVWSDYDIQDNPLIAPYRDLVELRVYDPATEAAGTVLEDRPEYLSAHDAYHWMNSGVLRFLDHELLAKVYAQRPFTVFPSAFFDTEWQIERIAPGLPATMQTGWFSRNEWSESALFTEAFAWHWHNSSFKHHAIEPGSKFALVQEIIDAKLRERGIPVR